MSMSKRFAVVAGVLLLAACAAPNAPTPSSAPAAPSAALEPQGPGADAGMSLRLQQAGQLMMAKKPAEALPVIDEVIAYFEKNYRQSTERVYSARWPTESLLYVLEASQAVPPTTARVYGATWGDAYFLKGYVLVELHRPEDAKAALTAAVALSPRNSRYLSERAEVYASQKDWNTSLREFRAALAAADFTPPALKNRELTRALRGMAFAQIELQDLDEAEALHRRVLQIDPNDAISLKELQYIRTLRARKSLPPGPRTI